MVALVGVSQLKVEKGCRLCLKERTYVPGAQMQLDAFPRVQLQQPGC